MPTFDPELDLSIERLIEATPETIWRCWHEPDLFKRWFTPPPVEVAEVDNDLQAGGRAFVVMKMPDGKTIPYEGCFVLAEPHKRLVYTDALGPGFRPGAKPFMTADVHLLPQEGGTLYKVHVMHASPGGRAEHEAMGFHEGWTTTIAQLDDLAQSLE